MKLKQMEVEAIESVLDKGDRVELIPGPQETVKIIHIKRSQINLKNRTLNPPSKR